MSLINESNVSKKSHGKKNVPDKDDFNRVKMSIEKKIENSLAALNRKVIQESNWLNAVCDSKVFSNRNVLDFFFHCAYKNGIKVSPE